MKYQQTLNKRHKQHYTKQQSSARISTEIETIYSMMSKEFIST